MTKSKGDMGESGILYLRKEIHNPLGNIDVLYVLDGDTVSKPIHQIVVSPELDWPINSSPKATSLRIFHFNDMHNHFCDLDPDGRNVHWFSQMVKKVEQAKSTCKENEAILFLSAGDDHTGTVFDDLMGWSIEEFKADASYRVLSAGGLDIACIGNHELDRGAKLLAHGIQVDAGFPLLSANIHSSAYLKQGRDFFPAAIAAIKGLRVGILGLTTRVETRLGQPDDPGLDVASPIEVLKNVLAVLADSCDAVILLSHCGFGDGSHASGKAVVARDVGEADFSIAHTAAGLTDKPMVLIGSHTHTVLNENGIENDNIVDDILITQAGSNGRFLGEIAMDFKTQRGVKTACLHQLKNIETETEDDYDVDFERQHIRPLVAMVEKNLDVVIGEVKNDGFIPEQTLKDRYTGETALANFMNDAIVKQLNNTGENIDLAFLNAASILAGLKKGPLTFRQWFEVMPYSDEIFLVRITGRQIEEILQSNAHRILRPEELDEVDVNGFIARGFLHCSKGLSYKIELNGSATEAVATGIEIFGQPISKLYDQSYDVAVTTYLALGSFGERWNGKAISGGVPGEIAGYDFRTLPARNTNRVYRTEMVALIRDADLISAKLDGRLTVI